MEDLPKNPTYLEHIATWRQSTDEGKKLVAQGKFVQLHVIRIHVFLRFKEAESFFYEAYYAALRGFGGDAPHVGMSANNLAELYRVNGQLSKAKELYFQANKMNQILH